VLGALRAHQADAIMGPHGRWVSAEVSAVRSPLYQRIRHCTVRSKSGSDMSNCENGA